MKIGIITIATSKYRDFVPAFAASVTTFFLPNHSRSIFVLTDEPFSGPPVDSLSIPHLRWPYSSLLRFQWIASYEERFREFDQLFFIDADMVVQMPVGDEIIGGGLVGVHHPTFYPGLDGVFERNARSAAAVPADYAGVYFQGCLFGGQAAPFLELCRLLRATVQADLIRGVMPLWHDESHLNWYFSKNPPRVLPPSYAYPDRSALDQERKIVHLHKNHLEIRDERQSLRQRISGLRVRAALGTRLKQFARRTLRIVSRREPSANVGDRIIR